MSGEHVVSVLGYQAEPQVIFSLLPLSWDWKKQVHALFKRSLDFLQPSGKPHWFSDQLSGLIPLVSDPRVGVPNTWLEPVIA